MATALPQYGQLQRDLAPHTDRLLALGVDDMRAAVMPSRFEEALEAVGGYVERHGTVADRATFMQLAGLGETVASWCDRLAALPGPPSIDHNDLHPGNVFLTGAGGAARARFYDWGDSVVAHPFSSMFMALGFVRFRVLDADLDDPRMLRLRDAYLEVFSDLAPHAELVEALELACRLSRITRALVWDRAVRALGQDPDEEFASAPFHSLSSLLSDSYLGGA